MANKNSKTIDALVQIIEPMNSAERARYDADTSGKMEIKIVGFHILFDRFVASSIKAQSGAKDYADDATARFIKLLETDPECEDMRTVIASEQSTQAETQHDVAQQLAAIMAGVYQGITGECFNLAKWEDGFKTKTADNGALDARRMAAVAAAKARKAA